MSASDDDLMFASDAAVPVTAAAPPVTQPWTVLVVDDDPEVHAITRIVVGDFTFEGRPVRLLEARSAAQAISVLSAERDVAVILLDVVMETEDAGLVVARRVREDLGNRHVRIILRTGQPGAAPELAVMIGYDINDYKAKSELTAERLLAALAAAFRAYRDISTLERHRNGLQMIFDASASLFKLRSMRHFGAGLLTQVAALLGVDEHGILCVRRSCQGCADDLEILVASGRYGALEAEAVSQHIPVTVRTMIDQAFASRVSIYAASHLALFVGASSGRDIVAVLETGQPVGEDERRIIGVFCDKLSTGIDNVHLHEQLASAQQATVIALAGLAEHKDTDTGNHVLRVKVLSEGICRELLRRGHTEVDHSLCDSIGLASVLHDVGKVGVPDQILRKPGRLDAEEWAVMKRHATIGAEILSHAASMVVGRSSLSVGAVVAATHHERWDGTGYPAGLRGREIPIGGRIVAVADVFDALTSRRPYKAPWPAVEAAAHIRSAAGRQFDPEVVDAFLGVLRGLEVDLACLRDDDGGEDGCSLLASFVSALAGS